MYLKSINSKQIYFSLLCFCVNFVILIFVFFIGIYFFFESSDRQHKHIEKDLLAYKTLLNKQYVLKSKVDTVYYHMSLLSTGKVENNLFLEQYITKDVQEIKKLLNFENKENFKGYDLLFTQLDSLLVLKDKIIAIDNQEAVALRDLNECMHRFKNVYTELTDDPSRKFNKR
ncbi:type VI secretion system TssO [Myroides fluvii]|uniref:type VI secretion system TssO n=1 Tax=Myroides fluvii TaxID=2572594 RepID=UPI00131B99ED|nr:type VI secretion system TssO [Myroides fluvii]